ncbi:hypothetical protein CL622_00660 [archaeon]|nr:hypothetical protein [archaeon]|tara:strand:- start:2478 stop:3191 length:714 start_codon:yes stop_codon:yes gene_type:complete
MKKGFIRIFKEWREIETFVLVWIILSIIFSFTFRNDWSVVLITGFVLGINVISTKLAARKYGCDANLNLWAIRRYGLRKSHVLSKKQAVPTGVIFPLLFALVSRGALVFSLVSTFNFGDTTRTGRLRPHFTEREYAFSLFLGLLPLFVLLPIFAAVGAKTALFITGVYTLGQLMPLPGATGMFIVFSSRTLYVFMLTLFFSILALLSVLNIIVILLLAITFAVLVTIFYYYNFVSSG